MGDAQATSGRATFETLRVASTESCHGACLQVAQLALLFRRHSMHAGQLVQAMWSDPFRHKFRHKFQHKVRGTERLRMVRQRHLMEERRFEHVS